MNEPPAPRSVGKRLGDKRLQSDERLARRAQKGDRRAFEAIYRRYHQDLYRFCLSLVGSPEDAEDALQATMVKVLRSLPGDRRQIRLRPWLYRIARNESIETLRRRREGEPLEPDLISSGRETAETVEAREHLRRLIDDLAALPERQRAALLMRELAGLGFDEIGTALETSEATVRQTVYEARLSLRQMETGREMQCKEVTEALSEADGRVIRRRDIQAHLRSCHECRAFKDAITRRRGEFGALAPLPVAVSAGLLEGILGASHGAASGSLAGAAGAAAGKTVATSAVAKSAATVAVVAAIGVTAADRGHLVDVPIGDGGESAQGIPSPSPPRSSGLSGPATDAGGVRGRAEIAGRDAAERRGIVIGPTGDDASAEGQPTEPGDTRNGSAGAPGSPANGHSKGKRSANPKSRGQGQQADAAAHGQETAAAHKSPRANPSPRTPSAHGVSKAPPKPAKAPGKAPSDAPKESQPPDPPPAPAEPPEPAKGGGSAQGSGKPAETSEP